METLIEMITPEDIVSDIEPCPYCGNKNQEHDSQACYRRQLVRLANLNWRIAVDLQKEDDKLLLQCH